MEKKKDNAFFGFVMGKWNQKEYAKIEFLLL